MAIGILTFVGTQSHGACLQAYALKSVMEDIGYEVEIIHYINPGIRRSRTSKLPWNAKSIKGVLGSIRRYPVLRKRWKKFDDFEMNYLSLKTTLCSLSAKIDFDAIIVGSDQVWNLEITDFDFSYFLDFLADNSKKLSYAASLGVEEFPSQYKKKCFDMLSDFKEINVREESLGHYLQANLPDKEIKVVLDPTLLLDTNKWVEMSTDTPLIQEKYMLVHCPVQGDESWNKIRAIAAKRKLKIVFITNNIKKVRGCSCLYAVSPIEYLNYIRYADTVITGSFHTLCFSLIFEKDFWCTESMITNRNARLINLLNVAGCMDRMIVHYEAKGNIDYKTVRNNIEKQRQFSIEVLRKMCSGLYDDRDGSNVKED